MRKSGANPLDVDRCWIVISEIVCLCTVAALRRKAGSISARSPQAKSSHAVSRRVRNAMIAVARGLTFNATF